MILSFRPHFDAWPRFTRVCAPALQMADLLGILLLANVAYFVCMSTAHFCSIKVPVLFVYYDVPFHAYQDKIISFCVAVYATFFYATYKHRVIVPYAIAAGAITTLGLCAVNLSDDLAAVLQGRSTFWYWAQTAMIGSLVLLVAALYAASAPAAKAAKTK